MSPRIISHDTALDSLHVDIGTRNISNSNSNGNETDHDHLLPRFDTFGSLNNEELGEPSDQRAI